jgi:Fe-S oxidoreductase
LPILAWSEERLAAEVDACNGCGACRSLSTAVRMCPLYREQPAEEASPRAKANLVAAVLSGRLEPRLLAHDEARAIADTCFNCHQCRDGCSAGVDIPALVTELKAAHVAANGLAASDWLLSRVDALSALGGAVAPLANRAIANPQARWIMEKLLGVARGRKLPPFTGQRMMRWAARHGLTRPSRRSGPRVLLFLDTFARRHDPLLVRSLVAVLEHNGIGVFIDPRQVSAGMPLVSAGDVDAARRLARTNVRVLAEAVRLGYRIVSTEPAAVTCIVHDYPLLVDDEDMPRVAEATTDAASFLWELHREGRLRSGLQPLPLTQPDGTPARLLYHAPCHARIGRDTSPAEHLLRLVPGLTIEAADRGCSGMAGTFGLSRRHYRTSLRAGLGLVSAMRSGGVAAGATECSACRIQMEQGTRKPTIHPVKLLARSYGLLPGGGSEGLDGLLTATSGTLTTS